MEEKKLLSSLKHTLCLKHISCALIMWIIISPVGLYSAPSCNQGCPANLGSSIDVSEFTLDPEFKNQVLQSQKAMHEKHFGDLDVVDHRFVFVSASMPMQTLIAYERAAQKYGFHLIMQGLIKGSYRETTSVFQEFIKKTGGGISIDPELFNTYQIKAVPTIILADKNAIDRVAGNITLDYALELFAKHGELSSIAGKALKEKS